MSFAQSFSAGGTEPTLKALHLPPSLPTADTLSAGLWTWANTAGNGNVDPDTMYLAVASTRVFASNGMQVEVPEHLRDVGDLISQNEQRGPVGGRALPGLTKPGTLNGYGSIQGGSRVNRRPVAGVFSTPDANEGNKVRRVYLQLDDLRLKSSTNAQSVVCRIQIGSQRPCSSVLHLRKEASKGFGLVVSPKEGFVFDTDEHESRVYIRVHGIPAGSRLSSNYSNLSSSPSYDNVAGADAASLRPKLGGILGNLIRSPTLSSFKLDTSAAGSGSSTPPARVPTSATVEAGPLLGEVMFNIPPHASQHKITGDYMVMSSNAKKEIAKLSLQIGAYVDEDHSLEPEVEPTPPEPEFGDFLNFLIHTPGASIWRKYWCVLGENELRLYDFEYRETKPVSQISLPDIAQIHPADPELICAPNCIELTLSPSANFSDSVGGWSSGALHEKPGSPEVVAYATADASDRMRGWMDKIARQKARMAGARTPVPPPRKLAASARGNRKPVAAVA
ncbi:hypothetical protein HKX48_005580 [Thoreauomyces humboldtii]|nr:hypothetical protein HKX48_005580 [Thoreauomyces humboldtii]